MLKVRVQSEAVRRNISLFKKIVPDHPPEYVAVVNRLTGAMRFSNIEGLKETEWKHLIIRINEAQKEIQVFEERQEAFNYTELDPTAYRIMAETLKILQFLVSHATSLDELTHLELEPSTGLAKDRVHEAWHQVDRVGAEDLLGVCDEGAYIFRKEVSAGLLEHELAKTFHAPVKCITLTFLDHERVVRDRTIVRYKDRWMFYDDDPTLSERSFETIEELLASMGKELKKPVLLQPEG